MNYKAKKVYQDETIANDYDRNRFFDFKGNLVDKREKELVYKAIKQTRSRGNMTILDLPCGTGRVSLYLAQRGFKIIGVDISANMIKQAQKKMANKISNEQILFQVGDGEHLSFQNGSFDGAISLRLFGHLPPEHRVNVLRELARVSKSFVVIAYYHKHSLQYWQRKKKRAQRQISWYPVDQKQIDTELNEVGLYRIKQYYLFPGISETIIVIAKKR